MLTSDFFSALVSRRAKVERCWKKNVQRLNFRNIRLAQCGNTVAARLGARPAGAAISGDRRRGFAAALYPTQVTA